MSRIRSAAAIALAGMGVALAVSGPATAADAPASPDARCKNLLGLAPADGLTTEKVTAQGQTGCRFSGLRLKIGPYQVWTVDSLTLDRLDFSHLQAGSVPMALSAKAEGIRFSIDPERAPAAAYQMRFTQKPFEIRLDYQLDPGTGSWRSRTSPSRASASAGCR